MRGNFFLTSEKWFYPSFILTYTNNTFKFLLHLKSKRFDSAERYLLLSLSTVYTGTPNVGKKVYCMSFDPSQQNILDYQ